MLKKILSGKDCAACRFCCSFRRQSLWETPLFTTEEKTHLESKYPQARFKPVENSSWTFDIDDCYKTDDPEEEAPCPFLDTSKGCILGAEEKPFDCSIWPLRAMNRNGRTIIALTPTCPSINKVPFEEVEKLVNDGLREKILSEAQKNPDMIKQYRKGFLECNTSS